MALMESGRVVARLDAHTREVGRRGVAEARRVLADTIRAAAERAEASDRSGGDDGAGDADRPATPTAAAA
jgi:hypothetical protein